MPDDAPLVRYDILGRPIKPIGDSFLDDAMAEAREDSDSRGIHRSWSWISERAFELYQAAGHGDHEGSEVRFVQSGYVEHYSDLKAAKLLAAGGWTKDADLNAMIDEQIRARGWVMRKDIDEEVERLAAERTKVLAEELRTKADRQARRDRIRSIRQTLAFGTSMKMVFLTILAPIAQVIYRPAAPYISLLVVLCVMWLGRKTWRRIHHDLKVAQEKVKIKPERDPDAEDGVINLDNDDEPQRGGKPT
jgi:hypothetical protein